MENKIAEMPRRARLDLMTTTEKSIYFAFNEVEKLGADVKLTEAMMFLQKAKDLVSDYIDNQIKQTA